MADISRLIECSVRIYGMLSKIYPASFRREYENELTQVFRELATDALRRQGALGLLTTWFRVFGDLLRTAPQEHLIELQRRFKMKTAAFAGLCLVLAVITQLFFILVGLALTASSFQLMGIQHRTPFLFFVLIQLFLLLFLSAFITGIILSRVKNISNPLLQRHWVQ